MLPTFAGEEPYYCWFARHGSSMEEDLAEIDGAVQKGIKQWRGRRRECRALSRRSRLRAVLGSLRAHWPWAIMLWQQQQQANCTWPLRFTVLTCCFVSVAKARSKQGRVLTIPSFRARRRYGCTPKAMRRAWVRARVASTYPLYTSMATVISAWGKHASWCAKTAIPTAHKLSPSTLPTTCPLSLPTLPVSSTTSAHWLRRSVEVKGKPHPSRSSRRPLAALKA